MKVIAKISGWDPPSAPGSSRTSPACAGPSAAPTLIGRSELRGLAYHRALAPRLRRSMVDEAARKISRWQQDGRIDTRYAQEWHQVLAMPVPEIRRLISADDARGRDLRQNSPFAGLLSEAERRRILEGVR